MAASRVCPRLRQIVMDEIPTNPGDDRYQLGTTLGADARFWRRAKWNQRFRLLFLVPERAEADRLCVAWPANASIASARDVQ